MSSVLLDELIKMHTENIVLMSRFSEMFAIHGEEAILLCIYSGGRPVFAGDLKESSGLTSGRIATILKQLEAKELIVRSQDENDKRKTLVQLTAAGAAEAERILGEMKMSHKGLIEYLGDEDSAELIRLARRVSSYFSENESAF